MYYRREFAEAGGLASYGASNVEAYRQVGVYIARRRRRRPRSNSTVRYTAENRKFIQAPSPEIWSETISGGEEVLAGVALFLATSSEQFYFMGC